MAWPCCNIVREMSCVAWSSCARVISTPLTRATTEFGAVGAFVWAGTGMDARSTERKVTKLRNDFMDSFDPRKKTTAKASIALADVLRARGVYHGASQRQIGF